MIQSHVSCPWTTSQQANTMIVNSGFFFNFAGTFVSVTETS